MSSAPPARVLLTGASRGIGVTLAETFARRGAELVLTARSESGLEATAERVRALGGTATVIPADMASAADRRRLIDEALAGGRIDGLIANAGVEFPVAFQNQTEDQIALQIEVNLSAPLHLTRLLLPALIQQGRGSIVLISSMSGKSPTPYNAVYTATKHGLNGFAASLRIELEETGVHAGVVCPGFVADAGMWADTNEAPPRMMAEVPLRAVADATAAVWDGKPEVIVTPMPVRPMLALGQLFPSLDRKVLGWMGVLDVLKRRGTAR